MNAEELLRYALDRFEEEKYDEALEAFALAYCKGYEREWILENIYRCYVEGNEEEFRRAYESRDEGECVAYEDCLLDFVPYREGEYYIFDKEQRMFRGVFSLPKMQGTKSDALFEEMEFSAAVIAFDWNWNEQMPILAEARNRRVYAVVRDMKRCASFWRIPELAEYRKNICLFSSIEKLQEFFHQNTAEYLPQAVFGTEKDRAELTRVLDQEHAYRLTPEGRNTDNVLLTIAIPTYHRGNLLLKRLENLRQMRYDAEVEIAISKNGTDVYQEEYDKASQMRDARINYYDHGRDLVYRENWRYVVGMAHGKYVLFVSDEDDVVLPALEHYLKLLADHPAVNLVQAKSTFQNSAIGKRKYGQKGLFAFDYVFLSQPYLSGLIMRREDFLAENFERLDRFEKNSFYGHYPHEWWCALLSMRGDYMEEPVILISEGEVAGGESENERRESGFWPPAADAYASYRPRLWQFKGIVEFLHWMMEGNEKGTAIGLYWAIRHTAWVFLMAREYRHNCGQFKEWTDRFYEEAKGAIDGFHFEEADRERLLEILDKNYADMLETHEKLNAEESEG